MLAACSGSAPESAQPEPAHPEPAHPEPAQPQTYDQVRPEITEFMTEPAILVFSASKGWRHNEGIAGADFFFVELARARGFGIFTTENGAVFNAEDLARFKVVVFNNMTGDTLSPAQETAFQTWLEAGGGWIGIHGSGDASHEDWDWYADKLIGPMFLNHPADPQFQDARIVNLGAGHPVMQGVPDEWSMNDEWYTFDGTPQEYGLLPLAGLDEASYDPVNHQYGDVSDLRMGPLPIDHPVLWAGCPGQGRSVYSAFGHSELTYKNVQHRQILSNAFDWVSGASDARGEGCPAP